MRKIKKALALSLALAMGLSLVACGDKTDNSTTESKSSEATSEAASSEDASSEEASSEDASGAAKIEAPSTDGWDDSKKIYAYSWDEDFSKKLNVVLDKFPEYKDYVEFVHLVLVEHQMTTRQLLIQLLQAETSILHLSQLITM